MLPDGELAAGARRLGVKLETPVWRLVALEARAQGGEVVVVAPFLDEDGRRGRPGSAWGDAPAEVVILGDAGKTARWRGRIGPVDRDDERQVRIDATSAILLYETRRDLTHCDGSFLRLAPRRFDPAAGRFRAASVAPDLRGARPLRARAQATAARAQTFRAVATTSMPDDDVEDLGPPTLLDDGDPRTVWTEERGGWGRGETFVFRAPSARYPVRGLWFVPADAHHDRPTQLLVVAGAERFLVELPERGPQWIELPAPVTTACVEVSLAAVADTHAGRTGIAELTVVTDRDAQPQLAAGQLVELVASGDDPEAEALLTGPAMVDALLAGAERREPVARRRIARALARIGDPRGAAEVVWALRDADEAEGTRLAAALTTMGAPAQPSLAALLADDAAPVAARVHAAAVLGKLPEGWEPLLRALGRGPREVRGAVIAGLAGRGELERVRAVTDDPDPVRAGDAWWAWARILRRLGPNQSQPTVVEILGEPTLPYPLRYRVAQAAALLADIPMVRDALITALARETEPAVKEAALAVLDPAGHDVATSLLADPDPGVRAAAVSARRDDAAARQALADRWPVVRRASLHLLGGTCTGGDAVHGAATGDRDEATRREALGVLVRCKDPRAGRALLAVIRDARLSPPLRSTAAALAADSGDARLVEALADELGALRTEIPYSQSEGQIRVAAAIAQALGRLKDPRATRAVAEAAADPAVPPIQAAALTALGELCPAGAQEILLHGAASDDALVARAAKGSLRRCKR